MRLLLTIACLIVLAQWQYSNAQAPFQTWLTYQQRGAISGRFGYSFDLNHRWQANTHLQSVVTAGRAALDWQVSSRTRISAGYAWFGQPAPQQGSWLHEHRPHQQVLLQRPGMKWLTTHRFRLEQRFRQRFIEQQTRVVNTLRLRYMLLFQTPVVRRSGKPIVQWQIANELMLHAGQSVGHQYFEQNRSITGFVFSISNKLETALLYQYTVQRNPLMEQSQPLHVIRLTVHRRLAGTPAGR